MVNEVDFENPDTVHSVFEEIKNLNNNTGVYKLGWQGLNIMFQGGIRRGECIGVEALQHKYKTGTTLSIFSQIATLNTPIQTKEEIEAKKKPLLVRFSFEDNLTNNLQFIYQYLRANEGVSVTSKDFETISASEMTKYILSKLTATGFHIKMCRIDPNQWTYSSLVNKIIDCRYHKCPIRKIPYGYVMLINSHPHTPNRVAYPNYKHTLKLLLLS